jgi:hypothetical protein
MACGAEMILIKVMEDVTMPVPGFKHHDYMCPRCHDTEQRLVFSKHDEECGIEAVPSPSSTTRTLYASAQSLVNAVRAKVDRYFS